MVRKYVPRERWEYRIRYRREFGRERTRVFSRLAFARRHVEKVKSYDSGDPLFPADRLLYITIDRRQVGEWEDGWPEDQR